MTNDERAVLVAEATKAAGEVFRLMSDLMKARWAKDADEITRLEAEICAASKRHHEAVVASNK